MTECGSIGLKSSSLSAKDGMLCQWNALSWAPFSDNLFNGIRLKFSLRGNFSFPKTPDEYVSSHSHTCHEQGWKPNLKSQIRLEDKMTN